MKMKLAALFLIVAGATAASPSLMGSLYRNRIIQENTWKTVFVDQILDHFNLDSSSELHTFSQRLLINTDHWKPNGAVFFYTGNEGDIELFAENTGFIFEIAPAFDAAVVFAEHRYYGKSLPFGNESLNDWTHTRFLTSEQAMADFVENVKWLKLNYLKSASAPVITFGGSYGGMLAAWMRMKYPSLIQGAIAASAPVWMFPGMAKDQSKPYQIITESFGNDYANCPGKISKSWDVINDLGKTRAGRLKLHQVFHTCSPELDIDGVQKLIDWLSEMYFDMAMVNYPYPTSFLAELPAWPVKEFCKRANGSDDTLRSIALGTQVYLNYTGKAECLDLNADPAPGLGTLSWAFQACTENILPISSDKDKDMFPSCEFDLDEYVKECRKEWGTEPRPYWLKYIFGGLDGFDFSGYSRIFFSNGKLDPWSAGGTDLVDESFCLQDCPNVVIADGAHHLDIRASDPADPDSVKEARKQEVDAIKRWTQKKKY